MIEGKRSSVSSSVLGHPQQVLVQIEAMRSDALVGQGPNQQAGSASRIDNRRYFSQLLAIQHHRQSLRIERKKLVVDLG